MSETDDAAAEPVSTLRSIAVEELDTNLYRSADCSVLFIPPHGKSLFGGQIIGQAIQSAIQTIPEGFYLSGTHSYFLVPGRQDLPIVYHVQRTVDGRHLVSRFVTARQDGKTILTLQAFFHKEESEKGVDQMTFARQTAPSRSCFPRLYDHRSWPSDFNGPLAARESKSLYHDPTVISSNTGYWSWVRCRGHAGDNPNDHRSIVCYLTDFWLLTCTFENRQSLVPNITHMTSLDHVVTFHQPFRADDWLLYQCQARSSGSNRSLCKGHLYREDGTLVATVHQEGLIRTSKL